MADKPRIAVSESFVSQDEKRLRENVRRVMDEYIELFVKSREFPQKGAVRE